MDLAEVLVDAIIEDEQSYRDRQWKRLLALREIPDPVECPPVPEPSPVSGADPSKVDWDHVITADQRPANGQRYRQCVIEGRFFRNGYDVHLEDVHIRCTSPLPGAPRPIAEFAAGAVLEGVTVEPEVRSVMWSEGVRTWGPAYSRGLKVRGTVDGLGVVTASGQRTDGTHVDLDVADLAWFAEDPNHKDEGTHNDPIQLHGSVDGFRAVRPILDAGPQGTSCIMANAPGGFVRDFWVIEGDLRGGRERAAGVNFGDTLTGERVAIVDTRIDCPVDVYASDAVAKALRLDRSTRSDGTPAVRSKS